MKIMFKKYDTFRIMRFLASGTSAAAVEFLSFIILYHYLTHALVFSNVISFGIGLVTSFLLNKKWVFKREGDTRKQAVHYGILALFNVTISTWFIWFVVTTQGIPSWTAKISAMIAIAIWNYFIFSRYIFRKDDQN